MKPYVLSLDQGTTSSRAILFDVAGNIKSSAQYEFTQHYPQAGWVEHDPLDILSSQKRAVAEALERAAIQPQDIAAIGITNQRETTIVWEKATGKPVYNAIVWQCRRTAALCETLKAEGLDEYITEKTGLLIDAYFSATKIAWILDHVTGARARADGRLLKALDIPSAMLPQPVPSSAVYGTVAAGISGLEALSGVPIAGAAGDQQAALFGQACFAPGQAKNTYGTGCFLMMNTGETPVMSKNRLLTTIAWGLKEGKAEYALEGSIFNAGSVIKWLRDDLGLLESTPEINILAESVKDAGGMLFVPAFTGLGAPYWDMYARGTMVGITRGTTRAHVARAVLESIAYQVTDLTAAMQEDSGFALTDLKVDGGASVSNVLMQFQADMLNCRIHRPLSVETTAAGAAFLAGLAVGLWPDQQSIAALYGTERVFAPEMGEEERAHRYAQWKRAVSRAVDWVEHA